MGQIADPKVSVVTIFEVRPPFDVIINPVDVRCEKWSAAADKTGF